MKKRTALLLAAAVLVGVTGAVIAASIVLRPSIDPQFEAKLAAATGSQVDGLIQTEADRLGVTAVSVTVLDGQSPPETRHFGRSQLGGLMQAASLSKAVAAAVILIVAEEQGVDLDEDIADQITSVTLSDFEGGDRPITLRALLSHTTGASQSGYAGYPREDAMPSSVQVLTNPPRFFESRLSFDGPSGEFSYSGGGYVIAQLWAEDVTSTDFASLAQMKLLAPLGMSMSTFAQPIDDRPLGDLTIIGADSGFDPLAGVFGSLENSWHNYPEQAAAGLWTTSADYARFAAALMDAATGTKNAIPITVAKAMIAPQTETDLDNIPFYGLGVMLLDNAQGNATRVAHTGGNAGYRTYFVAEPASATRQRRVVVSFANTANAPPLNKAIATALLEK